MPASATPLLYVCLQPGVGNQYIAHCHAAAEPPATQERDCAPVRVAEGLVEGCGKRGVAHAWRGKGVDACHALAQLSMPAVQLRSKEQGQSCPQRVPWIHITTDVNPA